MQKGYGKQQGSSDGSENRVLGTMKTLDIWLIAGSSFAISGDGSMDRRIGHQYILSIQNLSRPILLCS